MKADEIPPNTLKLSRILTGTVKRFEKRREDKPELGIVVTTHGSDLS
jgi:hypothetical protein